MRLNETEIENIKKLAHLHFGEDVQVILFGSRASDEKRGGDIDIFTKEKWRKAGFSFKNKFHSWKWPYSISWFIGFLNSGTAWALAYLSSYLRHWKKIFLIHL